MPLSDGTRLGAYQVVSLLGRGGMGDVYRARDTRLDRKVAIKVLPELFAADPERLTRFEREAKALASLSHPHIAQIYEIAELPIDDGKPGSRVAALVMELVEGDDLSVRIAAAAAASRLRRPGGLPVTEALAIALQIADALEAAHERGLIHRDLKPANIKVSADGHVRVLDFGLAKAADGSGLANDPANSPTMSIAGTRAGIILGTAAYMAPEQARGQTVDRRADIWAFGVVLFEMLSGRRAFAGDTISDVIASVLKNDIDWTTLPADLPAPIARLLRRCLTPDRKSRLRDIGEARIAIADCLAGGSDAPAPATVGATAPPRSRALLVVALATMTFATVVLIVAVAILGLRRDAPIASRRYVVAPPDGVTANVPGRPALALAPDGWTLAFTGLDKRGTQLYLRGAGDFDPRRLSGTEGGSNPVFSPDGKTLAFLTPSHLKAIVIDGGAVTTLAPASDPRGVTWADKDTLVYAPESVNGLAEISARGGAPRTITTLDAQAGERTHRWPHALPGGRWILFTVGTSSNPDDYDGATIDAVDRQSGQRRRVFAGGSMARYAPTGLVSPERDQRDGGHLVFVRGGGLYAVRFDPSTLTVSGQPSVVLPSIGGDPSTGLAHVAWTNEGTVAYVPGDAQSGVRQLVWADFKGTRQPIPLPPALYNDIRVSPDGTRVAMAQGTSGLADIWVYAFARGTYTRVTFTGVNGSPVWSADSHEIFFSGVNASGGSTIFRTDADGGREPVPVVATNHRMYLKYVSPNANWGIVDYIGRAGARADVGRLPLHSGAAVEPLAASKNDEWCGAVSPNGRFLAYQADPDGRPEVYVRALDLPSGRWQVSNAGGEEPMWAPDGTSIYYRFEGHLLRVPVTATDPFQAGPPTPLFDDVYDLRSETGISYEPHPDGTRVLMLRPADVTSTTGIRVVTGWFDELRRIK